MSFGMSVSAPILAEIRDEFDLSFAMLGLIVTMPPLARIIFTLPAGNLADQYSSRVLLSAGVATAAVGGVVSALAPAFVAVLAGTLIVGAGSAVIFTGGMAGVARRADPHRRGRAMVRLMAGFHLGALLSPALGGLIASVAHADTRTSNSPKVVFASGFQYLLMARFVENRKGRCVQ